MQCFAELSPTALVLVAPSARPATALLANAAVAARRNVRRLTPLASLSPANYPSLMLPPQPGTCPSAGGAREDWETIVARHRERDRREALGSQAKNRAGRRRGFHISTAWLGRDSA